VEIRANENTMAKQQINVNTTCPKCITRR